MKKKKYLNLLLFVLFFPLSLLVLIHAIGAKDYYKKKRNKKIYGRSHVINIFDED